MVTGVAGSAEMEVTIGSQEDKVPKGAQGKSLRKFTQVLRDACEVN